MIEAELENLLRQWDDLADWLWRHLEPDVEGLWVGEVRVPPIARRLLGDDALIRITVIPRTKDF
jgi:hypothetical protein